MESAFSSNSEFTSLLCVTGFGFSIPAGATIDDVLFRLEVRRQSGSSSPGNIGVWFTWAEFGDEENVAGNLTSFTVSVPNQTFVTASLPEGSLSTMPSVAEANGDFAAVSMLGASKTGAFDVRKIQARILYTS
jgi:hypothetical protein